MPSSSYHRLKKHRYFQRLERNRAKGANNSPDKEERSDEESVGERSSEPAREVSFGSYANDLDTEDGTIVPPYVDDFIEEVCGDDDDDDSVEQDSDDSIIEGDELIEDAPVQSANNLEQLGLVQKVKAWALKYRKEIKAQVITDMLLILRSEGCTSFPKTAATFLGTTHSRELRDMQGIENTMGQYIYLGIMPGLIKILSSGVYQEEIISLQVHVDGMQLYQDSPKQIWPVAIKLYHAKYISKPFVAGIYCGDKKPASAADFFSDFVQESNDLVENGVIIGGERYKVEIQAIIADSPARAFLKCCKGAGGYFACERCTTEGCSVGSGRKQKRVYPETVAELRTKQSYELQTQPQHHHEDSVTPLLSMTDFDLIKQVIFDPMHLFYLNNTKWCLEKWTKRSSPTRIKLSDLRRLSVRMKSLKADIPCEFQRDTYDVSKISGWKASQYKFMLNYCGALVFQDILPSHIYRHFLLFVVASRVLNSKTLVIESCAYANELLRTFFKALPTVYKDKGAQVLSWHNAIHIADDAQHFRIPLNELSAFWGESYIGSFKKLVHGAKKPLTQIVNRLEEEESGEDMQIQKRFLLSDWIISKKHKTIRYRNKNFVTAKSIKMKTFTLAPTHPNNVVLMDNDKVFMISEILVLSGKPKPSDSLKDIYIVGREESSRNEAFNYPDSSINVGIIRINDFASQMTYHKAINIKHKCAFLTVMEKKYAITLLHE